MPANENAARDEAWRAWAVSHGLGTPSMDPVMRAIDVALWQAFAAGWAAARKEREP